MTAGRDALTLSLSQRERGPGRERLGRRGTAGLPLAPLAWLALLPILGLALALRMRLFMGAVGPDNFDYLQIANSLMRGTPLFAGDAFPFHVARLAMTIPLALAFSLFGVSEASAALWPTLCSLGSVLVAFALGRRVAGPAGGLVAALGLAIFPLEVVYATTPLPDTVASFFLGLTVWLALVGLDRPGRAAALCFLAAGVSLGVAYYARVNAPVVLAVLALWLLWQRRRPPTSLIWLAVGAALVLALGTAFVVAGGGPPWFELAQYGRLRDMNEGMVVGRGGRDPLFHFAATLVASPLLAGWTILGAACALGLALARDRRVALPAIWIAVWYLYLELGSQYPAVSLVQKEPRYLTPLALPLALLVGIAAARIADAAGRSRPRWAVAAVGLVASAQLVLPGLRTGAILSAEQRTLESLAPRQAALALRDLPPLPVYVTSDWLKYLNFFGGFVYGLDVADQRTLATATLRKVRLDPQSRPLGVGRGLVVHDETYGLDVPPDWVLLRRVEPKVAIYYAPDPSLPDSGLYEPRLGLAVAVSPTLTVVAAGTTREPAPDRLWLAVDWLVTGAPGDGDPTLSPRAPADASLALSLRAPGGVVVGRLAAPLDAGRALPAGLWRAGGVYRVYYDLPRPPDDPAGLELAIDAGRGPVSVGPIGRPALGPTAEPELFEGVRADQDRALAALTGWGSYSQPPYLGGKAAIARLPDARASGALGAPLPPGDQRLWLRVYSYGPAENRVEVRLNGQAANAAWRTGAPGIGWVALDYPGSAGGPAVEIVSRQVGQPFLIVDQVAAERG
jgi:4-amino-4-deoxy-L-arabinose transferase-like glycosyltransferase